MINAGNKIANKSKIIFLIGPTAIGKTALSIKLARKINAEIVSCDSMQVYKGMDILSSKPDAGMQEEVRHHLLNVVSVKDEFSVASYRKLALQAVREIHKRNKIPLFVGGSGLYMSVVIDGIFKGVAKDETLRTFLYKQAKCSNPSFLYNKLKKIDKQAARKIHPNDLRRIIRALEVYIQTGRPISQLKQKRKGITDKYDIRIFGLNKDREKLYKDINTRVAWMFERDLIEEVKRLLSLNLSLTCRQAIGINEIKGYLEGKYDLEKAEELIRLNTRHYARKQLTWFRKDKRICWIDVGRQRAFDEIIRRLKG